MNIGIDAHMIGERETGNERYTVNLIRGLAQLEDGHRYHLLTPHPHALNGQVPINARFSVLPVSPAPSLLRIPIGMPRAVRSASLDVLHVSYIAPPLARCPTVVTVHDLSYLAHPEWVSPRVRLLLRALVGGSVRRAARVIAISEFTRSDLLARYHLSPERIVVIPEAPAAEFTVLSDAARRPLPAGVREPFVLAVGNLEPRKNLAALFRAFSELAVTDTDTQLVVAGKHKFRGDQIAAVAGGLRDRIHFTGYVDDATLTLLYNRATLFVYPSLYEGFGLPPLEAMASGCPVVASNAAAIPETVGGAGIVVDATSPGALAAAMRRVLVDPALRRDLVDRGRSHVQRFSWRRTAELTRAVYEEVASRPR